MESPNYTESIYFWRIQAGGENDTSLLIGKSFEKLLRFLAFDGVCMRTDCPKKETSGTCLYASMSFKHLVQRHFDDCLLGSNSCKGKTHFQEKTMVRGNLRAEHNFFHFFNFRGQCIIPAGVAPHYLSMILSGGHEFCFPRTAWAGWHGVSLC